MDEYLCKLRDLTVKVLSGADLKKEFGHLVLQKYPSDEQLSNAYLVLLSHLLNYETSPLQPHQMPSGAAFPAGNVPEPASLAELGSLWMILGIRLKNEILLYAGLKIAVWQLHTLDTQGLPHLSLWSTSYRFQEIGSYNHLLFTLAYRITSEQGFYHAAQVQTGDRLVHLLELVPEKMSAHLSSRPFAEEMTVGLLKFQTKGWSAACTLSGKNSGFFSCHKTKVAILNAGPQTGLLDDPKGFGIERGCSLTSKRFHDILWDKAPYHFRLKGWTKIFALPTWMHVDILYETQKISLSTTLQEGRPHDAQMAFYIRCDHVAIGGKTTLRAATLERYQGRAIPLEFSTGDETLFMQPEADEMQVIPLSGGGDFWGADFLVAFPMRDGAFQCTVK